jgi:DNA-binding transcriptional ArsR family regulator
MSMRLHVVHAMNHPTRRRIVEALWHSAEPLSAIRFHSEYVDPSAVTLGTVTYHVRQLERDGITSLDGSEVSKGYERRRFVLEGPNSGEAVRHLGLTAP